MNQIMRGSVLMKLKITVALILIIFSQPIFAQIKFNAEINNTTVGKSEYIQLQFTVRNAHNVDQITPPIFTNFTIISGPAQQSGMNITNGVVDKFVAISYILQAKKTGSLTIGAATAMADGHTYQSKPVKIIVTNAITKTQPSPTSLLPFPFEEDIQPTTKLSDDYILKKGESIPEKIKKNLFVKLDVSNTSCYVGQPIVATYKLYSRLKTESNVFRTPSFNGFSVNELSKPEGYNLTTEKLNGREYNVYILRKVELYPLQAGKISLESLEVENKVTFIDASKQSSMNIPDIIQNYNNGLSSSEGLTEQTVVIKNKPLEINIKPLPFIDSFKNFKGAVGSFTIKDYLDKKITTTSDGGNLTLVLEGAGNIHMVNAPKINWPKGIEGFEPTSSQKIDKMAVPLNGQKIFSYPFSVSKEGSYIIPSIDFTYFDLEQNKYKTISTDSIRLTVKEGLALRNNSFPASSGKNKITQTNWVFIIGPILLGIILFIFLYLERSKSLKNGGNIPKEEKSTEHLGSVETIPLQPLGNLEKLLTESDTTQFYIAFKEDIINYLSFKLHHPKSELTRKKINELLEQRNFNNATSIKLNSLLDNIDMHLYSASAPVYEMREAYEKGMETIQLIEKQLI